jgi:selenocysteine lyase/cysteine desulfurase
MRHVDGEASRFVVRYADFVNGAPLTNQPIVLGPRKETLRSRIAGLAGCDSGEIAFTRNTTEALNTGDGAE